MKKTLFLIVLSGILITACHKAPQTTLEEQSTHDAYVSLAEAADSVSHSLTQLGATEQAAYPPISVAEPPNPATYGMEIPASIEWAGPVEPLIRQIAAATNYRFKALGKKPSIPINVSVTAKNLPMGDILRDVGYQCGKRAQVIVFPSQHIIELRYANI